MCLTIVDKKTKIYKRKIAYKAVTIHNGTIRALVRAARFNKKAWNTDKNTREIRATGRNVYYPAGYHMYHYRTDAIWACRGRNDAIIFKVEYDEVVATGTQQRVKVIVAKKFRFLE